MNLHTAPTPNHIIDLHEPFRFRGRRYTQLPRVVWELLFDYTPACLRRAFENTDTLPEDYLRYGAKIDSLVEACEEIEPQPRY